MTLRELLMEQEKSVPRVWVEKDKTTNSVIVAYELEDMGYEHPVIKFYEIKKENGKTKVVDSRAAFDEDFEERAANAEILPDEVMQRMAQKVGINFCIFVRDPGSITKVNGVKKKDRI